MAFRVAHDVWLATESARVKGLLLMPKWWGKKWSHQKLQKELADLGLVYSKPEIEELNDELHKQGVVEDVPED